MRSYRSVEDLAGGIVWCPGFAVDRKRDLGKISSRCPGRSEQNKLTILVAGRNGQTPHLAKPWL